MVCTHKFKYKRGVCSCMLAYARVCSRKCSRMLAYARVNARVYARVGSRMPVYAYSFIRMLADPYICIRVSSQRVFSVLTRSVCVLTHTCVNSTDFICVDTSLKYLYFVLTRLCANTQGVCVNTLWSVLTRPISLHADTDDC